MDGIKHSGRFAEMERLVNDYFNCHIAPIMSKTQQALLQSHRRKCNTDRKSTRLNSSHRT